MKSYYKRFVLICVVLFSVGSLAQDPITESLPQAAEHQSQNSPPPFAAGMPIPVRATMMNWGDFEAQMNYELLRLANLSPDLNTRNQTLIEIFSRLQRLHLGEWEALAAPKELRKLIIMKVWTQLSDLHNYFKAEDLKQTPYSPEVWAAPHPNIQDLREESSKALERFVFAHKVYLWDDQPKFPYPGFLNSAKWRRGSCDKLFNSL